MPRILRIINRLNLGGPTYNVAYLSKFLPKKYETIVVAGEKDSSEASSKFILNRYGIEAVHIPEMKRAINPWHDRVAFNKIKKLIREFKPDIVHTHAAKSGTLGRLAASQCKVPVIVHTFHGHVFHSYFNSIKTRTFLEIERYLATRSHAIVAISKKQKLELAYGHKVCPAEKIHVVPLGFDLDPFQEELPAKRRRFRQHFNLEPDEIAIGIIGRLVPVKNHNLFLHSLSRVLAKTNNKVRAFIIGDGEDRLALEMLARELNIPFTSGNPPEEKAALTFTSWMTNIDEVNAGLDIVALTSRNEGTPVSLIEAQAANRPIVSTRVGGIEDVVMEGTNALLSDVNDQDGFVHNLMEMIETDTYRKENAEKGFAFVNERFNYTRLIADMDQLYQRLLP